MILDRNIKNKGRVIHRGIKGSLRKTINVGEIFLTISLLEIIIFFDFSETLYVLCCMLYCILYQSPHRL